MHKLHCAGCSPMASAALKHEVEELLKQLPETATLRDLLYALEVRTDIEAGLADSAAGRVTDVKKMRREFGVK